MSVAAQYIEHAHLNISQMTWWNGWAGEKELQVEKFSHVYMILKIRKVKETLIPQFHFLLWIAIAQIQTCSDIL